ncbi:uncharacterized protein LOC123673564 isoform X3 [Harmonia axyridis]|uniref:uncharacterized protein LOC123673564 isoform X3 n=1 Tax=Harmonia axyridis TaxID=115357 RepID=UPI001E278884|nr:uncharacterized protein LOC123673564 isoform X3 [Harmonia axyridis]XP_045464094.1 uncharacterized protein LOC123673564 isoform X3 [Harmonia axyridis]
MDYVIWRVLMKKYSKVRLGLYKSLVTPVGRPAITYDNQSWKEKPEKDTEESEDSSSKSSDSKKSKAKRVKNFLKSKYKTAIGSKSNGSGQSQSGDSASWYLEKITVQSEVSELNEVFEEACESLEVFDSCEQYRVANVILIKNPAENAEKKSESLGDEATSVGDEDRCVVDTESGVTSPFLTETQEEIEGNADEEGIEDIVEDMKRAKRDVAGLVDRYFRGLYKNYERSKKSLIRQARDLLVCEYYGSLERFENEFCVQAAKLLQFLKDKSTAGISPKGWPLCIGASGIVIHLSPLDPAVVRNKDCYLSLKTRSLPGLEVALVWRKNHELHFHTIAEFRNPLDSLDDIMCSNIESVADLEISSYDDYDGTELPELLQNLLVSVEHAIKRIPLDDLSFPCSHCHEYIPLDKNDDPSPDCACQCSCNIAPTPTPLVSKKEISIQTSPMFEFAGSIPHIDSDAEDDKESIRSGCPSKRHEVARPKRIADLPEKLLLSGIYLPGTTDVDGRPIVLCYAQNVSSAGLNKYEIAKLLLYYSSLSTTDLSLNSFTVLIIVENEEDFKILQLLDKSVCLIENHIHISRYIVWSPKNNTAEEKTVTNRIQTVTVTDAPTLKKYIKNIHLPRICGGESQHDQVAWVAYFQELEPFLGNCKSTGRSLLSTLSKLRSEEVPSQITRKFLNHQCRQISKALQMDCLKELRANGSKILAHLDEQAEKLPDSADVQRKTKFARVSFDAVIQVAERLEKLERERSERLKELAKFRTFQKEVSELITWTRQVADETLNNLVLLLRSSTDSASVKEVTLDFEKFFFGAWHQVEKAQDFVEECKSLSEVKGEDIRELANSLNIQMKVFRERLEETRVQLENSSRCFLLLESCHDILEDDNKEQEEFIKLALRSGNTKLQELCKDAEKNKNLTSIPPDKGKEGCNQDGGLFRRSPNATSTPTKTPKSQIRRRSISSHAYIYHCSHHAAGEICTCDESDTESSSLSYRLKKRYLLTLQGGCSCKGKDTLERKNSATLDGIKEERESVENLLEKIDTSHNGCKRCDSGVSTGDNSIGEESVAYNKKKLQRTCSCQYCRGSCVMCSGNSNSSSADSNQDNTESQQDSMMEDSGFVKSDDIEDDPYLEEKRTVSPITANKHLYCHASNLDLPSDSTYSNMDPKTQKTLKYIIKEMIETERDYVKSLDYVIVNYIPEISREDIPQALRGQRNIVFGNIEKIFEFHSQHFLTELEECENNPLQVGQIFLKHDKKFYLYALYNKNKPKSDTIMSEYGTIFFKSKQIELDDKMDLASYLLKPVQRMGKYALLLQQMMKACMPPPSDAPERVIQDFDDLRLAEEMVRFQLRHGNDLLAMDSIRECDVNLKEQGRLLRQNEFIVWEGRNGKKSLRQVFLFEDLILFSKAKRFPDNKNLDLYYYKNSIKMTDIGLTPKVNDSLTKFEIWFRKRKPNDTFTLQAMTQEVKKSWTEELSQLLWKQAIRNRAARMAEMSSMGIGNKPCLDIKPSADQISHRSISIAQLSRSKGAPRFRNSIAGPSPESCRTMKRPNSVISMSSVSSGSTSSGASGSGRLLTTSISCDSACDSPKPYHRSATLNSQCSVESGIIADMSIGSDDGRDQQHISSVL